MWRINWRLSRLTVGGNLGSSGPWSVKSSGSGEEEAFKVYLEGDGNRICLRVECECEGKRRGGCRLGLGLEKQGRW